MNEARFTVEDPRITQPQPPAGDDLLPPVEPPSAGFIIQLFVIPALIVILIVAAWLAFNWLVRAASTPEDVIQGLEQGPSVARWQRASELANMLRDERFADFKKDGKNAASLARILDREIEAGEMSDNDVAFRDYLARALGEFEVQEGMETLLKAATTNRDVREQKARDGAIQAIAVRAYNLQKLNPPQAIENPELEPMLLRLAEDEDPSIRFQAAFALGKVGSPAAIERLAVMVDDPDVDTRYNAAVALAHRGNEKSLETLAEMLDLEEHTAATSAGKTKGASPIRSVIVHTAIDAAIALAKQKPDADFSEIVSALNAIVQADDATLAKAQLPRQARFDAQRGLDSLRNLATPEANAAK
jgi:HEAT repeat protein